MSIDNSKDTTHLYSETIKISVSDNVRIVCFTLNFLLRETSKSKENNFCNLYKSLKNYFVNKDFLGPRLRGKGPDK